MLMRKNRMFKIGIWTILLFTGNVLWVNINTRYRCAQMPNGLMIGRATFFSSDIGWEPDLALKLPNGQLLIRGIKTELDFWDENSLSGYLQDISDAGTDPFIYVKNLGLIRN